MQTMQNIKFIYFDVGGVLLRDFSGTNKWQEMIKALGVTQKNESTFNEIWQQHRNKICIDCDVDHLIPIFKKKLISNSLRIIQC